MTPLPQLNTPLVTPQLPFDEVSVKLETVPERVYVARVCVDQVPAESRPPVPVLATMVALVGMLLAGYEDRELVWGRIGVHCNILQWTKPGRRVSHVA